MNNPFIPAVIASMMFVVGLVTGITTDIPEENFIRLMDKYETCTERGLDVEIDLWDIECTLNFK